MSSMAARRVSEAPTLKANFATGALRRSASLPDIFTQFTSEYFAHEKQDSSLRLIDARPESSSLPANSNHVRNGCNLKHSSESKDEIVPPTKKKIDNLTIPALKDELKAC